MFIEEEAALAKHALRHGRLAETEQRLGFIADTIAKMRNKEIE